MIFWFLLFLWMFSYFLDCLFLSYLLMYFLMFSWDIVLIFCILLSDLYFYEILISLAFVYIFSLIFSRLMYFDVIFVFSKIFMDIIFRSSSPDIWVLDVVCICTGSTSEILYMVWPSLYSRYLYNILITSKISLNWGFSEKY